MADSADFQQWKVTEPYLNLHCGLGEAPYYEVDANTLRFVDIKKHRLHVIDLSLGPSSLQTLQLDMPIGVTADIEGVDPQKKILVGGKAGLAVLDRETGKYKYLARFYDSTEADDRLRSNDGTVDSEGRFWVGTMNDFHVGEPQAEGESDNLCYRYLQYTHYCHEFLYI
jgi:sugar lactone lactonase YvrE